MAYNPPNGSVISFDILDNNYVPPDGNALSFSQFTSFAVSHSQPFAVYNEYKNELKSRFDLLVGESLVETDLLSKFSLLVEVDNLQKFHIKDVEIPHHINITQTNGSPFVMFVSNTASNNAYFTRGAYKSHTENLYFDNGLWYHKANDLPFYHFVTTASEAQYRFYRFIVKNSQCNVGFGRTVNQVINNGSKFGPTYINAVSQQQYKIVGSYVKFITSGDDL